MPLTQWNALRDLQIPLYAKTHVRRNVTWRAICGIGTGPTLRMKNRASTFRMPDTLGCTMCPVDPTGCKNTSLM
jgi:hypothetical protein